MAYSTFNSDMLEAMQEAVRQLRLPRSGTKDELILRIYDYFGMKKLCPKQIPAGIAFAMR